MTAGDPTWRDAPDEPPPLPDDRPGRQPTPFGPGGRPWAGARAPLAALLVAGGLALLPIMFSDRAPGLLDRVSRRIERSLPWWLRTRVDGHLPEPDLAVHLLVYGGLALLVGLVAWSWASFVRGQVAIFVASVALELLQPVFATERTVQLSDVVGNATGQIVGALLAVALVAVWRSAERRRTPG